MAPPSQSPTLEYVTPVLDRPGVVLGIAALVLNKGATDDNARAVIAAAVAAEEAELGDSGRVLLRASGTEPMVRVMVEAAEQSIAQQVAERLAAVVREQLAV